MKKDNKIIDDFARFANSAFTGMVNIKNELSVYITQQIENLIKKMKIVTREEFEVVKKIAQENRIMIEKFNENTKSIKNKTIESQKSNKKNEE